MQPSKGYIDLVIAGAGIKGIAFVGAVKALEEEGYGFRYVAGTSAGAIVASLLAAGYTADEMYTILKQTDYRKFKDKRLPFWLNVLLFKGLYKGDYVRTWIKSLLDRKHVRTFDKLAGRLKIIASDVSHAKMCVFGSDPNQDIADAVRASMSIPFFFEPVKYEGAYLVDGAVNSNMPVWLFDEAADCPTLGLKTVGEATPQPSRIRGPISLLMALFKTMMSGHDNYHIETAEWDKRVIGIPNLGISPVQFDLSSEEAEALYQSGYTATKTFLAKPFALVPLTQVVS